jgi:hypothetical protein
MIIERYRYNGELIHSLEIGQRRRSDMYEFRRSAARAPYPIEPPPILQHLKYMLPERKSSSGGNDTTTIQNPPKY